MLKYFYITNNPKVALACERAKVDRIFVDMEYVGKDARQSGLDTVQNHHSVDDVKNLRAVLTTSELLVRVNPIGDYSVKEINEVIEAGADIVMLPMWKSVDEVKTFIDLVDKRAKTMLLLETEEARLCLDEVLKLDGIDEIHIGLNDLHLSQNKKFMFELYTDGTVDAIVSKLKEKGVTYGIGGVSKVNYTDPLPAEFILAEHYRLGSSMVILSRAFCDWTKLSLEEFESIMTNGIAENREYEKGLMQKDKQFFDDIHKETAELIQQIVSKK